jgi:hypothetical protein
MRKNGSTMVSLIFKHDSAESEYEALPTAIGFVNPPSSIFYLLNFFSNPTCLGYCPVYPEIGTTARGLATPTSLMRVGSYFANAGQTAGWYREKRMKLRDHPLMSYHGLPNWPPAWSWIDGPEDRHPTGEIGILRMVLLSKTRPADRCVLLVGYQESCYLGCLLFEDQAFCRQMIRLLQHCCNRPIMEIGDLDLSYTL